MVKKFHRSLSTPQLMAGKSYPVCIIINPGFLSLQTKPENLTFHTQLPSVGHIKSRLPKQVVKVGFV